MPKGIQPEVELLIEGYLGVNNAMQFSQLNHQQSPRMQNGYMSKIGAIGKRPGTKPITATALAAMIEYVTTYKSSPTVSSSPEIYVASGTTLYKFNGIDTLTALTMTNTLAKADIYSIGFTNTALTSRLIIGDGGSLKACDGSSVVNITPAANHASPAPPNVLANVNAKGCKFIWEYAGYIFITPGTNELFYTELREFDYVPDTFYFLFAHDNDHINGQGQAFDAVCLIPLRRSWAILAGKTFNDFDASKYLNTDHGVIAPRSIAKLTYPDGVQTVAFLSDDEVHEIYTAIIDGGGRQYATRSIMKDKIDFVAIGLTDAEKAAAVGFFDSRRSVYLLSFQKTGVNYTYAYDVRNREWYTDWLTFNAKSYAALNSETYFVGDKKHLMKFDDNLYSDWNESTQTTGTPVYFKRYSSLLFLERSGYSSYWDYYLIEQKQYPLPAPLDVYVIFTDSELAAPIIVDSSEFTWDETAWDEAQWANEDYTDLVNEAQRYVYREKAKYVQTFWESNYDAPVEVYWEKWIGRTGQ